MKTRSCLSSEELRQYRARLRYSQSAFAECLGLSSNTYARMERGELPVRRPIAYLVLYVVADLTRRPNDDVWNELLAARAARDRSALGSSLKR